MIACRRRAASAEAMTSQARSADATRRPAARSLLAIAGGAIRGLTGGVRRLVGVQAGTPVAFPRRDTRPERQSTEQGHDDRDASAAREENVDDVGRGRSEQDRQERRHREQGVEDAEDAAPDVARQLFLQRGLRWDGYERVLDS